MHYYIYPAGKTGRTLGRMLDYCEMNVTYGFIDDNQEGITLKEQALNTIKNKLKITKLKL